MLKTQPGDHMSPKELNHVQFLLKYHAVKLCAPKERLAIFRKRAVESFGNMPEYSHNWARDTGNSNFGRVIFWKCISDQLIPPFKTLQPWKEPEYQQGKITSQGSLLSLGGNPSSFFPERSLPGGLTFAPRPSLPLPLLSLNHRLFPEWSLFLTPSHLWFTWQVPTHVSKVRARKSFCMKPDLAPRQSWPVSSCLIVGVRRVPGKQESSVWSLSSPPVGSHPCAPQFSDIGQPSN